VRSIRAFRPVTAAVAFAILATAAGPNGVHASTTTVTALWSSPNPSEWGDEVILTASVRPSPDSGQQMDGQVSFYEDSGFLGFAPVSGNGIAHLTVPGFLAAGPHEFFAYYSGSETFGQSYGQTTHAANDSRIPVRVDITSSENPSLRNTGIEILISTDPIPDTGSVRLRQVGGSSSGPVELDADGHAKFTWWGSQARVYELYACTLGSLVYKDSCSQVLNQEVFALNTTTTLEVEPSTIYPSGSFTARVTISPPPESDINLRLNGVPLTNWFIPVDSASGTGEATFSSPNGEPFHDGVYALQVVYAGGLTTNPSSSEAVPLVVGRDPSVLDLTIEPARILPGQEFTVSARLTPAPTSYPAAVGVTFSVPIGVEERVTIPLDSSGTGSVVVSANKWPGGMYSASATFRSDLFVADAKAMGALEIFNDVAPPVGNLSVPSPATNSRDIVLETIATDDASGVTAIRLSNDGEAWQERSYAPTQAWTLDAGSGAKAVWAMWGDAAGNWSVPTSDSIVLDTAAPTATAPKQALSSGVGLSSGRLPIRLTWTGSDALSGIASYEVARQTDGGAWSTPTTLIGTSQTPTLSSGHTYRFRVRAVDKAGNVSGWQYGTTFRLSGYSEATGAARYAGSWSSVASTAYWGGKTKAASAAGANVKFTFTGRSIAWVTLKAPARGKANIYVNGTFQGTVDLYASSWQGQRIAWAKTWTTSATRTLEIRVLGTSGRPRVDVDGFWVGS